MQAKFIFKIFVTMIEIILIVFMLSLILDSVSYNFDEYLNIGPVAFNWETFFLLFVGIFITPVISVYLISRRRDITKKNKR